MYLKVSCFPCLVAVRCIPMGWEDGGKLRPLPGHTSHSPAIYCILNDDLFPSSFLRGVCNQPTPTLCLASAGLMLYQQVFELKGTLISQPPLKPTAVRVLNVLSASVFVVFILFLFFNKMCIVYCFSTKKRCHPLLFFPFLPYKNPQAILAHPHQTHWKAGKLFGGLVCFSQ